MKKWDLWNGALLAVLGLLIIIFPTFCKGVVVVLLGLGAIVYGIYSFKVTKAVSDEAAYGRAVIIKGIISILIGVCAVVFPFVFIKIGGKILTILSWILFAYLILSSILGFYAAALLRNTGISRKKFILENISLLLLAVLILLISPKGFGTAIIRIIGIIILLVGIALIVYSILAKKAGIDPITKPIDRKKDVVIDNPVVRDDDEAENEKKSSKKEEESEAEEPETEDDDKDSDEEK